MTSLAENIREFMDISPDIRRMDSMMVESNIRKMGRLELLYTCLADLVKRISRDGHVELLDGLAHYAEADDRNKVIYYNRESSHAERLQKIIDDASTLLPRCKDGYEHTEEYQFLLRAISEQTKEDGNGNGRIPKGKKDGMDSSVLQNPSDPDATFRKKGRKRILEY